MEMQTEEPEFVVDLENPNNYPDKIVRPEGFEKERRDCTVRALSLAANLSYKDVHEAFTKFGRKNGHGVYLHRVIHKVCDELNLEIRQVKRSGTLNKFIKQFPKGNYICTKRGHAFTVIDGVVHDEYLMGSRITGAWSVAKKESTII